MSMQERLDVPDLDGGPVEFAAVRGQKLREVAHCGEPGLERGVPARVGAGAAGAVTTGEEVFGEPGYRVAQWFGHRVDAGPSAGGGASFVAIGRQRQLVGGEEVLQSAREWHVDGDGFQQRLRMHRMTVDQMLAESGEHGAGAAGMVTADQVGGELVKPVGWIIQCLGEIGRADEDPVRRAFPAGPAPAGAGEPGDPPAVDAGGVRIRWPARM
jgi:hypothetical protein